MKGAVSALVREDTCAFLGKRSTRESSCTGSHGPFLVTYFSVTLRPDFRAFSNSTPCCRSNSWRACPCVCELYACTSQLENGRVIINVSRASTSLWRKREKKKSKVTKTYVAKRPAQRTAISFTEWNQSKTKSYKTRSQNNWGLPIPLSQKPSIRHRVPGGFTEDRDGLIRRLPGSQLNTVWRNLEVRVRNSVEIKQEKIGRV